MPSQPSVVVVGGANADVKARSAAPPVPATSNPGTTVVSPGGVGRNVAENLARLGTPVRLVSVVGTDPLGDLVLEATRAAGVDVSCVRRARVPTGTYTAVLDPAGELVTAVSDMAAADALTPGEVRAARAAIAAAALVVLDGNLTTATVTAALEAASVAGVPVLLDPVSVPKASRLGPVVDRRMHTVTPDRAELLALADRPLQEEALSALHDRGVAQVWVRLGADGSLLSTPAGAARLPAVEPPEVVDVTGAGDAMLAAYCHASLAGAPPVEAAAYGHAAAALTVASPATVRPDLTDELVRSLL